MKPQSSGPQFACSTQLSGSIDGSCLYTSVMRTQLSCTAAHYQVCWVCSAPLLPTQINPAPNTHTYTPAHPKQGSWGPALDLCKVLMAVRQLLAEPNPKDPLAVDIVSVCVSCKSRQADGGGQGAQHSQASTHAWGSSSCSRFHARLSNYLCCVGG